MDKKPIDRWSWILIYGGMLALGLGWFYQAHRPDAGWTLMVSGGVAFAIGVLLIFVRSRMGP